MTAHPRNEHLWKWGEAHDDGTYSHGPCVVKGCDREAEYRIPEPTDPDERRIALFVGPIRLDGPFYGAGGGTSPLAIEEAKP